MALPSLMSFTANVRKHGSKSHLGGCCETGSLFDEHVATMMQSLPSAFLMLFQASGRSEPGPHGTLAWNWVFGERKWWLGLWQTETRVHISLLQIRWHLGQMCCKSNNKAMIYLDLWDIKKSGCRCEFVIQAVEMLWVCSYTGHVVSNLHIFKWRYCCFAVVGRCLSYPLPPEFRLPAVTWGAI